MTWYERYRELNIDGAALGLGDGERESRYDCTPLGAEVIGWEGVDGIHYCFVRGFGDMVFAVEPMGETERKARPLAAGFRDFLRLLLACGTAGAAEQADCFDGPEAFERFLRQDPPDGKRQAALDTLREALDLTPMENPWQYVHDLQAEFDYDRLTFSEAYAGAPQTAEQEKMPWAVYYEGNFWGHHGRDRAGKKIPVGREFPWGTVTGLIPAVYICGKGVVADVCLSMPGEQMQAWLEKWLAAEDEETRRQVGDAIPVNVDLRGAMTVNGRTLRFGHSCGTAWCPNPPEGEENGAEARRVLEYYGLDPERAWVFRRMCFPWATKRRPAALRTLEITLTPKETEVPGPRFTAEPEKSIAFTHPVTGARHILTVQEAEWKQIPEEAVLRHGGLEYPRWFQTISCTAEPELPERQVFLRDRNQGDQPRRRSVPQDDPTGQSGTTGAASVGIIGGADGPTAILFTRVDKKNGPFFGGCSSLYFQQPDKVEWQMVFRRQPWEGVRLELKTETPAQ